MNRMIAALVLGLFLFAAPSQAQTTTAAAGDKTPKKRLLLITESKGFPHPVSARQYTILAKDATIDQFPKLEGLDVSAKDKKISIRYHGRLDKPMEIKNKGVVLAIVKPCLVETTFMKLAKETGMFDVDCSQDSRVELTGENLKKYDAVFFYTTGNLPLSDSQKSDFLAFVRNGKGFGGSHCATDTYKEWKEYSELIGGTFSSHPWTQKVRVIVEDKESAATKHLGDSFFIDDEIYQYRAPYPRDKGHVLLRLDMDSVKGLGGRKDRATTPFPGRTTTASAVLPIFYTALGHRPEVCRNGLRGFPAARDRAGRARPCSGWRSNHQRSLPSPCTQGRGAGGG